MTATEQFVKTILTEVPELHDVHEAHMQDNGGLLPHVFMGDVTRFALEMSQAAEHVDVLRRLLKLVEIGLRSDKRDVADLVAVSFLENLCGEDAAVTVFIPLMGETTRRELRSICGC